MFKLRVEFTDGQIKDVVTKNKYTIALLEIMMNYGFIKRLTCKLR